MTVSLPFSGLRILVAQGSLPELLLTGTVVEVSVTLSVGRAKAVSVGRGVSVGISVGGRGVTVGTAAMVSATMVIAAACAVLCTSTGFIVGAAGAPQALRMRAVRTSTVRKEKRFMRCEYLLMNLAIGESSARGIYTIVFYNDLPVAFCDTETAECFKILPAGDKCPGTILSNGSGKTIACDNEIPTLPELCLHVHG